MKHLSPKDAWAWLQAEQARRETAGLEGPLFVDVRMEIESLYVGRPPGVENIPWYEFPDLTPDPTRFAGRQRRADLRPHGGRGSLLCTCCTRPSSRGPFRNYGW